MSRLRKIAVPFLAAMLAVSIIPFSQNMSPASADTCAVPPSGLVSWWPGEGNGNDIAGPNDGNVLSDTAFETGQVNQGFSLLSQTPGDNPGTSAVSGPINGLPTGSSARTIMAWIKASEVPDQTYGAIIFHYGTQDGTSPPKNFHLHLNPDGTAGVGNGWGLGTVKGTTDVTDNEFHLIVGTYEGPTTNIARIYVDGQEQEALPITTPGTGTADQFRIGSAMPNGSFEHAHFEGIIDEVAIFNEALSEAEIDAIYVAGTAGMCQPTFNSIYESSSGLFPDQVCPAWTLQDEANPEEPVLSGGKLVISTSLPNSEIMDYIQSDPDLDITYPLVIEFSTKFISGSSSVNYRAPIMIAITTAPDTGQLFSIDQDMIFLQEPPGNIRGPSAVVDTNGAFHTYRIEISSTGSVEVFYDNVPTLTGTTYSHASTHGDTERIFWGEGSILASGTSEWEFFKHTVSTITCDSTPPVGTVVINGGEEATQNPEVDVTMTCDDGSGSGCETITVQFSNAEAGGPIGVVVTSDSDLEGEVVFAEETGNTGIFVLEILLSSTGGDNSIIFSNGDAVYAEGITFDSTEGTKTVDATFEDGEGNSVTESDSIIFGNPPYTFFEVFGTGQSDRANGVAADSTGAYVVGRTAGDLDDETFGGGDAFIRKYTSDGVLIWGHQFGTSEDDAAQGVAVDSSGVYVVGSTGGTLGPNVGGLDAFLSKFDHDGGPPQWTVQFGTTLSDFATSVALDPTGVYVAGATEGNLAGEANTGGFDAFVQKYAKDGEGGIDSEPVWTWLIGTVAFDAAWGVDVDSTTVYAVGGSNDDAFISRIIEDGGTIINEFLDSSASDTANGVAAHSTGIYVVGETQGDMFGEGDEYAGLTDAFIQVYSLDFDEILFADQFGTTENDDATGVSVDSSGVYLAGRTTGSLDGNANLGGSDAFVRKYSLDFDTFETKQFGTSDSEGANAVAVGSLYAAGHQCYSNEDCNAFVAGFETEPPPEPEDTPTELTLNSLSNPTATTGFTASGVLTNANTGEGLSGQEITFSGSGATSSLQPVTTGGVTFTGAIDLVSCPTPATPTPDTCTTDNIGTDDNTSNNIVLHLGVGGKITFPPGSGTVTAKLYLQDMGTSSFKYVVEEGDGGLQPEATSAGALSPIVPVVNIISGFTAGGDPKGIKEITITEGSVGIAAILTGNPDGFPVEQHQINFEEFTAGSPDIPFEVNPGFYFSTGFAQNTDATGLEITAHFEGSSGFTESDSNTEAYDVLANTAGLGGEGSQSPGGATGTSITSLDCNTDVGSVDTDDDGICDLWETSGITFGTAPPYNLIGATIGARDIFVEIDCMTGTGGTSGAPICPTGTDLTAVRNAFSAEGFTLHISVDQNNLAAADPLHVWTDTDASATNDFDKIKKNNFGTAGERTTAGGTLGQGRDYLEAKAQVYHYGLFAKNINTLASTACGPSGQAELRGNDFIVSVGCTGAGGGVAFANSAQERQGTLMHELGHNLGLRHGGGDDDNCKANLISVMSYTRQMPWGSLSATTTGSNPTEWALTYSRQDLADLNENSLPYGNVLPITPGQWGGTAAFKIIWGIPGIKLGSTGSSIDWNGATANAPSLNINTLSGMTGCSGTVKSTLKSYDEWTLLDLNFRDEGTIDGLVYPDPDTIAELTPEVLEGVKTESIVGPNNVFSSPGISILPDVAADEDNNIYVVWSERASGSGNFEVYSSRSEDGGATFTAPVNISNNAGDSLTPRIAVSDGMLYVVWSDKTGGTSNNYDIRFSKSSNMGIDWDPSVKLSSNAGNSLTPAIDASNSDIYVAWSDKTNGVSNNYDIQFKSSEDGGDSFIPNTPNGNGLKISNNAGNSLTPDVGVSSSGIFVTWSDTSGGKSGKFDILMKKSTDGGSTFLPNTANAKNISNNGGESLTPSLAVDGNHVYVSWSDTTGATSGKLDILFKKSIDAGNTFTPNTANAKNISTTSTHSLTPRITALSGSIYISWSDKGTGGRLDTFVKKSGDTGENFGAAVNISTNSGESITPAIVLTDSQLHFVWGDHTLGIAGDIMYASRIV